MTIQAPTRITIEVHHPGSYDIAGTPVVRVLPDGPSDQRVMAEPREDVPGPALFDPGPCLCLDDDDCNADHAND